ncbi:VOC family protein [Lentzea sp. NBRC 102530]|uniref:VOC family protein n=1 Tax=Lentzea sp. NBRC 102530 TaxID=3032201 RepID=UPI0024A391C8|nr:VOC family protein [Lentzea sp. NBRC 102530]GLY52990.1 VOC family protein [Lentzea sp. NBRC 102530]
MATRLNPYISFDGQARQAMEFYHSIFGGELKMNTFGEFGMQDTPQADQIMHAQLETELGYTIMASDTPPGMDYQPGARITISLSGDEEVLRTYFTKLAEGGKVGTPLEKQMWGDEYGDLVDQYGVNWMVNLGGLG